MLNVYKSVIPLFFTALLLKNRNSFLVHTCKYLSWDTMDILRNTKSIFGDNAGNALNWETMATLRNMKSIFGNNACKDLYWKTIANLRNMKSILRDNACKDLCWKTMTILMNMKFIFGNNGCKRFKLRHNDNFQEYGIHIWRQWL